MVQPEGIVGTGWPAVRDTCESLGIGFDRWQDGAGRLILAKNTDGLYATDTVVISIPRQVGKTYLIGWIVFALCLIHPGLTVMWTAHRYKTAGETFRSMAAMSRRKKLAPHIARVTSGAGDQAIEFANGSRVLFGARERGFGRGFSEVDVIVFDEAQILGQNAIDDMVPATNASRNPLLLYTGTPPKPTDNGEVFKEFRTRAIKGESLDVLYIEIGADPDAEPLDRKQWAKANPSFPHRTPERSMLRMLKNLTPDSWRREGLGIWDADAASLSPLNVEKWLSLADKAADAAFYTVVGIDGTLDRKWASVGVAGTGRPDGRILLEHVERRSGTTWVVDFCREIRDQFGEIRIVVDEKGPIATLADELTDIGELIQANTEDVIQGCSDLIDAVNNGLVIHGGQTELDEAVKAARPRAIGDRGVVFGRKQSGDDISPLNAVMLAYLVASERFASRATVNNVW